MLQYQTISPVTRDLLKELQTLDFLKTSRLVGGTALALQLGHRSSVDLDFFGTLPESSEAFVEAVQALHHITRIKESPNIHIYLIDNVKVDIVNYKYQWLDEPLAEDGLLLAGMRDIAAMKVAAIVGRGTKKDFIDLYFLLKHYSLRQILDFYMEKYPDGSLFIALKSLCYFEDAEPDPMPYMFEEDDWDSIKSCILEAVSSL